MLMPSQTEASPIAALEALSCELPVLISAPSNTDGVLVPGQHGWEIGEATTASIAGALTEIVATSAAARAHMGAAARARVLESFTIARVANDFMRRYDTLLASAKAA
jgi:glycosyltransferase involved in cell wall biosynthesis